MCSSSRYSILASKVSISQLQYSFVSSLYKVISLSFMDTSFASLQSCISSSSHQYRLILHLYIRFSTLNKSIIISFLLYGMYMLFVSKSIVAFPYIRLHQDLYFCLLYIRRNSFYHHLNTLAGCFIVSF